MTETDSQPKHSLVQTIFANTIFVTVGNLALRALNFLFMILVVRKLGDARYGQYSVVLAFVGLFQIFAELGISQYVMRESARDKTNALRYFWNLVVLRLILAVVNVGFITLVGSQMGYSDEIVQGIFIYTLIFLLSALDGPLNDLFQAYERMGLMSLLTIVGQVAFMILGAIFLFSGLSYIWLVAAGLFSMFPRIGLGLWLAIRFHMLPPKFSINPRLWWHMILAGLPFGVISLTMTIDASIDTLMLKHFETDQIVGWYNVAHHFIFSLLSITRGFRSAIVPSLARTYKGDPTTVREWFYRSAKFSWLFSIPVAVGGFLVANRLMVFLYKEAFAPSGLALQILIWDYPLRMYSSLCSQMATVIQVEKKAAGINVINAVANVILNFIFIPKFGLVGAALVSVITDLISALQFHFLMRGRLAPRSTLPDLLRILAASAVMGTGVWLAGSLHVLLAIGVGVVVLIPAVLLFRVLDADEWQWIGRGLRFIRRGAREHIQPGGG